MRIVILVALLAIGCSGKQTSCERGVHKVFDLMAHSAPKGSEPKADEQAVIDQVETMSIATCEKEGLDQAQLDCILAMKSIDDMKAVMACPALAAKQPSWLLAGAPNRP